MFPLWNSYGFYIPSVSFFLLFVICTLWSLFDLGDIKLPNRVQEAMQMQVEAERKKRAAILDSEGIREADINVAEGKRQSTILASGKLLESVYF